MDISSVSSLPVTVTSHPNTGPSDSVQVSAAVPDSVSSRSDPPSSALSQAATLELNKTRESPSADSLAKAVKQVNDSFEQKGQNLYASFEKDKMTGINVVKIIDKKTKEIVSQMPSKEMVALAQALEHPQGMRGQLIDATA